MQYALLKYRGLQPDPRMPAIKLVGLHNHLLKDSRDKEFDPFPYKYMLHPKQ